MSEDTRRRIRVLIVDDEEAITRILSSFLKREGYEPMVANRGDEAVDIVRKESPEVILMDVKMPGMNGIEAFHKMREFNGESVIMMLTAAEDCKDQLNASQHEVDACLDKPVELDELAVLIKAALEKRGWA